MPAEIPVQTQYPVVLIGGGTVPAEALRTAAGLCPTVVAADGGADAALRAGLLPDAVIGDMDSISDEARAQIAPDRLFPIAEQDSTDFDKALRSIAAPLILGLGFLGRRLDHELAALSVLVARHDRRCILMGEEDVVMAAPPRLDLALPVGTRLSLFPMAPVTGHSTGLRWPIDGLEFAPHARVGTSNETSAPQVSLRFDAPGMLVILPRDSLMALLAAQLPDGAGVPRE